MNALSLRAVAEKCDFLAIVQNAHQDGYSEESLDDIVQAVAAALPSQPEQPAAPSGISIDDCCYGGKRSPACGLGICHKRDPMPSEAEQPAAPQAEADMVTIPRRVLNEAYRGLKRCYEMPELRREIDRLLAVAPDGKEKP